MEVGHSGIAPSGVGWAWVQVGCRDGGLGHEAQVVSEELGFCLLFVGKFPESR